MGGRVASFMDLGLDNRDVESLQRRAAHIQEVMMGMMVEDRQIQERRWGCGWREKYCQRYTQ